MMMNERQAMYV